MQRAGGYKPNGISMGMKIGGFCYHRDWLPDPRISLAFQHCLQLGLDVLTVWTTLRAGNRELYNKGPARQVLSTEVRCILDACL